MMSLQLVTAGGGTRKEKYEKALSAAYERFDVTTLTRFVEKGDVYVEAHFKFFGFNKVEAIRSNFNDGRECW